jgi:phage shock protein PspC (stress-responsive transcriptional regulator)
VVPAVQPDDGGVEENETRTSRRLVRRSHDRLITGVCGGIADHFDIDPVIVRIAVVALTVFGGAGVLLYIAATLLIPEEGHRTSIGERMVRERRWARIGGFVLIAIALSSIARPVFWFGGHVLFAVALIGIGAYLLVHHGDDGNRDRYDDADRDDVTPDPGDADPTSVLASTRGVFVPSLTPKTERRRGGLGALTGGVLFVGAGVVGLLLAAGNTIDPTRVFAVALLIVGAALVASTWFGRGWVLIPLGLVLVGLLSASAVIDVPFTGGIGERTERPLSITEIQPAYHLAIGHLTLDLTRVDFSHEGSTDVQATVAIGDVQVIVPRNVQVAIHTHAGMGNLRVLEQDEGGVRINRDRVLPGGEGAPRIVLDAEVGLGQVEVQDAAA